MDNPQIGVEGVVVEGEVDGRLSLGGRSFLPFFMFSIASNQ